MWQLLRKIQKTLQNLCENSIPFEVAQYHRRPKVSFYFKDYGLLSNYNFIFQVLIFTKHNPVFLEGGLVYFSFVFFNCLLCIWSGIVIRLSFWVTLKVSGSHLHICLFSSSYCKGKFGPQSHQHRSLYRACYNTSLFNYNGTSRFCLLVWN